MRVFEIPGVYDVAPISPLPHAPGDAEVTPGSFDSNPRCHQTSSVIKDAPLSLRSLTRDHQRGHHTEHDLAKHTGTAASGNGASVQTILARRLEMRQCGPRS